MSKYLCKKCDNFNDSLPWPYPKWITAKDLCRCNK